MHFNQKKIVYRLDVSYNAVLVQTSRCNVITVISNMPWIKNFMLLNGFDCSNLNGFSQKL